MKNSKMKRKITIFPLRQAQRGLFKSLEMISANNWAKQMLMKKRIKRSLIRILKRFKPQLKVNFQFYFRSSKMR
jgi:hypothetical protein